MDPIARVKSKVTLFNVMGPDTTKSGFKGNLCVYYTPLFCIDEYSLKY